MDGKQWQVQSQSNEPPQRDGAPHPHPRAATFYHTCMHPHTDPSNTPPCLGPRSIHPQSVISQSRISPYTSIRVIHCVTLASLTPGSAGDSPVLPQADAGKRAGGRLRDACIYARAPRQPQCPLPSHLMGAAGSEEEAAAAVCTSTVRASSRWKNGAAAAAAAAKERTGHCTSARTETRLGWVITPPPGCASIGLCRWGVWVGGMG